uniref:Uncharacterized protein n=1 Tax=Aegilops tauschii subsp. strangulata TaxID=200361 RepID=A0A453H0I1_AEGTS
MEDQDAFERDFCQLKPYYMDTWLVPFFFTTLQLFSLSMHCAGCHLIRVLFPVLLHHPLGFQLAESKQISI